MSLINSLSEQATFSFTGKINVLHRETKQFLGIVLLKEGIIVESRYRGGTGKKTLFNILIDDMSNSTPLKFIVEPELIENGTFSYSVDDFKTDARSIYEKFLASRKLKPPGHLRLLINGEFILGGEDVTSFEFEVLRVVSDYSKVEEIYRESKLSEYEVTASLVSLRKKGALRVYEP